MSQPNSSRGGLAMGLFLREHWFELTCGAAFIGTVVYEAAMVCIVAVLS